MGWTGVARGAGASSWCRHKVLCKRMDHKGVCKHSTRTRNRKRGKNDKEEEKKEIGDCLACNMYVRCVEGGERRDGK